MKKLGLNGGSERENLSRSERLQAWIQRVCDAYDEKVIDLSHQTTAEIQLILGCGQHHVVAARKIKKAPYIRPTPGIRHSKRAADIQANKQEIKRLLDRFTL